MTSSLWLTTRIGAVCAVSTLVATKWISSGSLNRYNLPFGTTDSTLIFRVHATGKGNAQRQSNCANHARRDPPVLESHIRRLRALRCMTHFPPFPSPSPPKKRGSFLLYPLQSSKVATKKRVHIYRTTSATYSWNLRPSFSIPHTRIPSLISKAILSGHFEVIDDTLVSAPMRRS